MSRILVTGGAGFIGSNLCKRLLKENNEVICVDNLFTSSKKNIKELFDYYNFEFIRHDITFPLYLEVDEIYNLACPASPIKYQIDPIQTIKVNIIGSINMLGLAKRLNAKILQASTSEVYGDPEISPQIEDYIGRVNCIGPRSCYDEGKRCAESVFINYNKQSNVKIKIVRIFNTYGPNMLKNDGRVVSNFIVNALQNKSLVIYGDGSQTRSFCYIDDIINGLIKMMNSNDNIIGPINIGNPIEITINTLAYLIKDLTESTSEIVYKELPKDDPRIRKPCIKKAKEFLNWSPTISLELGLYKTIKYFREII